MRVGVGLRRQPTPNRHVQRDQVSSVKLFSASLTLTANVLSVLVLGEPFQPSLINTDSLEITIRFVYTNVRVI